METFFSIESLWLFLAGIPVGIYAIVVGGSMFLSLPVFQLLFPGMQMGILVANIKVGSLIRSVSAVYPVRKHVDLRNLSALLIPLCVGAGLGAYSIISVSQKWILPAIIVAILLSEFAEKITHHLSAKFIFIIIFACGIFGGILGAGMGVIILALVRMFIPRDDKIMEVRANAIAVELAFHVASLAIFAWSGLVQIELWLPWSLGSFIGGYLGGRVVKRTGKMEAKTQKMLLRIVFVVALAMAIWRYVS